MLLELDRISMKVVEGCMDGGAEQGLGVEDLLPEADVYDPEQVLSKDLRSNALAFAQRKIT